MSNEKDNIWKRCRNAHLNHPSIKVRVSLGMMNTSVRMWKGFIAISRDSDQAVFIIQYSKRKRKEEKTN